MHLITIVIPTIFPHHLTLAIVITAMHMRLFTIVLPTSSSYIIGTLLIMIYYMYVVLYIIDKVKLELPFQLELKLRPVLVGLCIPPPTTGVPRVLGLL